MRSASPKHVSDSRLLDAKENPPRGEIRARKKMKAIIGRKKLTRKKKRKIVSEKWKDFLADLTFDEMENRGSEGTNTQLEGNNQTRSSPGKNGQKVRLNQLSNSIADSNIRCCNRVFLKK